MHSLFRSIKISDRTNRYLNILMTHYPPSIRKFPWPMALGVLAVLLFFACANVVAPTGGARDMDPPEVVRSTPPNFSVNFEGERIRIFFNEFIELRNIRQQLLISPPIEQTPEVRIRGRSVVIDIEEELRPNSTYNFFFGDAIRDITEGNPIPNFQFVLSTGSYVDSLAVSGRVKNAFNLQPEEGIYVMLYENIYDSVPYLERPVYLAKTNKEGRFTISNMADGDYLMFALDDKNNNFKYDLPDERIGFLDSLVRPKYVPGLMGEAEDDTLSIPDHGPQYTLYLFQEPDTVQRLVSSSLTKKGLITIAFRVPFDSAHVRELREPPLAEPWHIPEFSQGKDTLKLWFAETGRDSLFLEVLDGDRILDTIRRSTTPRRTRETDATEAPPPLNISLDFRRASSVPFYQPLAIKSEHPVETIDTGKIQLFIHDSIPIQSGFRFKDHVRRNITMEPALEEETSYYLEIMPGAFTDIFGLTNDTLRSRFATTAHENYGNLIVDLALHTNAIQFILQLLDRNEEVIREQIIHHDGSYTFNHLRAGEYRVRLIEDHHQSGRWDPGNYLRKVQPEPVHMLPDTIQIRENWDVEMPWTVIQKH